MPTLMTSYALCIYERSAGVPSLVLPAGIPSNTDSGPCHGNACWRETARGFKYKNKDATPDGIISVSLKEGAGGFAKIMVKGKGVNLPAHSLPLARDTTVTVQLLNDLGICWTADYTTPPIRNTEQEFKDRSD